MMVLLAVVVPGAAVRRRAMGFQSRTATSVDVIHADADTAALAVVRQPRLAPARFMLQALRPILELVSDAAAFFWRRIVVLELALRGRRIRATGRSRPVGICPDGG